MIFKGKVISYTCWSGLDLETNPKAFSNSCERKRPRRDGPPDADAFFSVSEEFVSLDESTCLKTKKI
jgi:hypothetical protein